MIKTYKLRIAYDGTGLSGWQCQPDKVTVCQVMQDTFKAVFGRAISILAASRTDAGVHAVGQVACFQTDLAIDPKTILYAWNNCLPSSIVIRSLVEVSSEFHPHANVLEKIYFYHLFAKRPLPFVARYGWFCNEPLDLIRLKEGLSVFTGMHDFRSFYTGYEKTNTIRTINAINVRYLSAFGAYQIEVRGPGFLRYMIRRIVGACVQVANSEERAIEQLSYALAEKNPRQTFLTAPAHGLMLYKIIYKPLSRFAVHMGSTTFTMSDF